MAKYTYRENKQRFISVILIICMIFSVLKIAPKSLKIYFIDVGQGDGTLIVTPLNNKILIDGGGSEYGSFDVGKNTLLPYLLDRGVKKLDYIIISHFDTDHVQGLLVVMQNLKVNKVVIAKQLEYSDNYAKFVSIVKEKNIDVRVLKAGDRINIDDSIITYTGESNLRSAINLIIYSNIFQDNKLFCREYEDISQELSIDKQQEFCQKLYAKLLG